MPGYRDADQHRSCVDWTLFGTTVPSQPQNSNNIRLQSKKHDKIKKLAESKLDTISGIVSKAIKDSHISHREYQLILRKVEHYRKIQEKISTKSKKTTDAITAEQRETILAQDREEGEQDFLRKISVTSVPHLPMPCATNYHLHTICEDMSPHKSAAFTYTPLGLETRVPKFIQSFADPPLLEPNINRQY